MHRSFLRNAKCSDLVEMFIIAEEVYWKLIFIGTGGAYLDEVILFSLQID